jgi:outer membrane lipoprotein-sorting protein
MLRKILAGLALAALAVAVPASAQSVDDILAKNYKAKGGLEKLKAVKTSRTSGTMTVGPGMEVPFTMVQKRPNSMRMDITFQGMTVVQAYDGKTGWMINPMQGRKEAEPLPEDALKQVDLQADMDGPLVDYKAKGSTVELLGKEKVEGSDAYKIRVTLKSGDVLDFYLDADSYLEVRIDGKMKIRGTDVESQTVVGDYKEVDGLMIAHSMESSQKGSQQKQKMIIKTLELNVPVDDAQFKMPAAK